MDPRALTTEEPAPARASAAAALASELREGLATVLVGAPDAITVAVLAALSGQHLLIEDAPGVGKTMLAKGLASLLGATWTRIQGQPDLLPSDITGFSALDQPSGTWEFRPGPVFSHIVLCDELNRTPPRTQAALLETMEERQVSVDGRSWPLPEPHLVIATQNPITQIGTYPLVESQTDRFGLCTSIGYPGTDDETRLVLGQGTEASLERLSALCDPGGWLSAQLAAGAIAVSGTIADYIVRICRATRGAAGVVLGASPRAAISVARSAQAHAVLEGRTFVTPDDVKRVAGATLAHRLVLEGGTEAARVVDGVLESTATPRP